MNAYITQSALLRKKIAGTAWRHRSKHWLGASSDIGLYIGTRFLVLHFYFLFSIGQAHLSCARTPRFSFVFERDWTKHSSSSSVFDRKKSTERRIDWLIDYLIVRIGFDTAENEPFKVRQFDSWVRANIGCFCSRRPSRNAAQLFAQLVALLHPSSVEPYEFRWNFDEPPES